MHTQASTGVSMLFATTREWTERNTNEGDTVTFDLNNNQTRQKCNYGKLSNDLSSVTEVFDFFGEVEKAGYKEYIIYIHGYGTPPEKAFKTAKDLQLLFDSREGDRVMVIPFVWSTDLVLNKVEAYYEDRISAQAAGIPLARWLKDCQEWRTRGIFLDEPEQRTMHMLSYSMGNRVLCTGSRDLQECFGEEYPYIFKNIFMSAADVESKALEFNSNNGNLVPFLGDWLCVYYAGDDRPLQASTALNFKRRLGLGGMNDIDNVLRNSFNIDCNAFNQEYDPLGHGYFVANDKVTSPVFEHIWLSIKGSSPYIEPGVREFPLELEPQPLTTARIGDETIPLLKPIK